MDEDNQQNSDIKEYVTPAKVSGERVIQPSAALIEEMKAAQGTTPSPTQPAIAPQTVGPPTTQQPQAGVQAPITQPATTPLQSVSEQTVSAIPSELATSPQPVSSGPSSIYPEATRGINSNGADYPPPAPMNDEVKDTTETYTFQDGYEIGKSIFIYQFVAGIVIGLLSTFLIRTFHHAAIVLALIYVVEYLVTLLYLPYYVLRSEKIKEALWATLLGTAVQTIIITAGFVIMTLLLKALGSLGILEIFVGIGFLVASYFLTKLSWGIAFSIAGKIKNKLIVKAIGIGLLALFVGYIAYHFVVQTNEGASNAVTSVQQSTGLTKYHVSGNPSFSVDFYTGSKTSTQAGGGGSITYSTGHAVQGVNFSISNAITLSATNSCSSSENSSEFSFRAQGSTGIVCVSNNKSMTSYIGYIQVDGKSYVINMFAFSYQQKLATVETIFNSLSIN